MATLKYYNGSEWVDIGGGSGGTSDYTALTNKPQINGTTLTGNKTPANLGLSPSGHTHVIGDVDTLSSALAGKVAEPASDGSYGQVLATDGNGGRYWKTASGGGGGGSGLTLLWTNSSPSSNFSAKTVALDLSGYSAVVVILYSSGAAVAGSVIVPKGGIQVRASVPRTYSGSYVHYWRAVSCTDSGVTFGGGNREATSTDAVMVPYKIYGL